MGIPRIDDAIGVVDGANVLFSTPNPYVPGTLVVMLNGRQLDREFENGWLEVDPGVGTFEMKVPPLGPQGAVDDPGDLVSAYYDNALETAGGGSEGGVPEIDSGRDVRPVICGSEDVVPGLEADDDSVSAPVVGAENVRPRLCTANDIRPRIDRAEEI